MLGGNKVAARMVVVVRLVLIFLCAFFLPHLFLEKECSRNSETKETTVVNIASNSLQFLTKYNYRIISYLVAFVSSVRGFVHIDSRLPAKQPKELVTGVIT